MLYDDQSAVLVGASGGIGQAIARELLDGGSRVALTYHRNPATMEALLARGRAGGSFASQLDLTDPDEVSAFAEVVYERLGAPSILVSCAGIVRDQPLGSISIEDWRQVLDANLSGNFYLAQAFAPHMRRAGGRIVFLASVSGLHGQPGQASYAASKGGLIAMTRSLARELGPLGLTVNAIAAGPVETAMIEGMAEPIKRDFLRRIPLRRFASPADIVPVARLLMARDGGYVTGQVVVVDGGLTA